MAIGDKDPNSEHARRSRAARGWHGVSTLELAHALGKTGPNARRYVERRESGEMDYSESELRHIADITGVPLPFMLHGWDGFRIVAANEARQAAVDAIRRFAAEEEARARARSQERPPGD